MKYFVSVYCIYVLYLFIVFMYCMYMIYVYELQKHTKVVQKIFEQFLQV